MGPLRRGTMAVGSLLQAALSLGAAALVLTRVVPEDAGDRIPDNLIVLLPLAMLAFNSAGQIVQSRFLGFNEIPTVVLTSTYCDLMFDPLLFTSPLTQNSKRNRRFLSAVLLLLGAALGGYLTQNGKIENAIWVVGALKIITAGVWLFWPGEGSIRLD
jgi:Na+/H+ antiporter NhaD/arsenite permease-like protein